jgi:hypothetical protein
MGFELNAYWIVACGHLDVGIGVYLYEYVCVKGHVCVLGVGPDVQVSVKVHEGICGCVRMCV